MEGRVGHVNGANRAAASRTPLSWGTLEGCGHAACSKAKGSGQYLRCWAVLKWGWSLILESVWQG